MRIIFVFFSVSKWKWCSKIFEFCYKIKWIGYQNNTYNFCAEMDEKDRKLCLQKCQERIDMIKQNTPEIF